MFIVSYRFGVWYIKNAVRLVETQSNFGVLLHLSCCCWFYINFPAEEHSFTNTLFVYQNIKSQNCHFLYKYIYSVRQNKWSMLVYSLQYSHHCTQRNSSFLCVYSSLFVDTHTYTHLANISHWKMVIQFEFKEFHACQFKSIAIGVAFQRLHNLTATNLSTNTHCFQTVFFFLIDAIRIQMVNCNCRSN